MSLPFPEPTAPVGSQAEVFLRYLDYFRDRVAAKLRALPEGELRASRLPSGWTPLELAKHLTFVELRWLEWGFEGKQVRDPRGDERDGRWYVAPEETPQDLLDELDRRGAVTREIVGRHDLGETGQPGERWDGEPPATLERVLFHLLQEYARHVGHLDIVAELAGDRSGELLGTGSRRRGGPVQNTWVMAKRLTRRIDGARRRAASRAVHWAWGAVQRAGQVSPDVPAARAFREFGAGSIMAFPPGSVYNQEWMTIGADTLIAEQVTMSAGIMPGQDLGPEPVLRIGDRCVIGRGSHVVAHQSIDIGDDVWTGPYVYITDQNHGYADPEVPIGRQFPVNRPVTIGAGSWLGAGAIILPGAKIGRNVVIAAGSVVRGEIPDRCVAAGVPAKIVRQHTDDAGWGPAGSAPDGKERHLIGRAPGLASPGGQPFSGLTHSTYPEDAPGPPTPDAPADWSVRR